MNRFCISPLEAACRIEGTIHDKCSCDGSASALDDESTISYSEREGAGRISINYVASRNSGYN